MMSAVLVIVTFIHPVHQHNKLLHCKITHCPGNHDQTPSVKACFLYHKAVEDMGRYICFDSQFDMFLSAQ